MIRLILILSFFAVLLPPTAVAQPSKDSLLGEEYAVYSAIILKDYIKDGVRLVVVITPTCCEVSQAQKEQVMPRFQYSVPAEPFPSQETLDSYVERNRTSVDVYKLFRLNVAVQIVPYKKIESLFDMIELEEDWKTFYRMYPHSNGYLRLSRVGFNKVRTEALVNTGWMRGEREGEGHYFLLSKKDGRWRIERSIPTWMV